MDGIGGRAQKSWGYVAESEHAEARYIAQEIDRLADEHGIKPSDVAIFYRTNAQSRALEELLMRAGLPYRVVGGTRFYERKEIKDALAYLRASACSDSATYPTILVPSPDAVHSFLGRRLGLRSITAFAAERMFCVER